MTTAGGKSCMRQREGWSWDDGDEEYHGHGGHQILLHHTPAARAFLEAGKEKRWSTMGCNQVGVCFTQNTIWNDRRWSTARTFFIQ